MRFRPTFLFLALALAACGSSTPTTDTTTTTTTTTDADVSGNWTMAFSNMVGGGLNCSTTAIAVTIAQSGEVFSGSSQSSWTLTCTGGGQTTSSPEHGTSLTGGTVSGSHVSFSLATNASTQVGTLSGNVVSGTANWQIVIGGTAVTLIGQFTLTH